MTPILNPIDNRFVSNPLFFFSIYLSVALFCFCHYERSEEFCYFKVQCSMLDVECSVFQPATVRNAQLLFQPAFFNQTPSRSDSTTLNFGLLTFNCIRRWTFMSFNRQPATRNRQPDFHNTQRTTLLFYPFPFALFPLPFHSEYLST